MKVEASRSVEIEFIFYANTEKYNNIEKFTGAIEWQNTTMYDR